MEIPTPQDFSEKEIKDMTRLTGSTRKKPAPFPVSFETIKAIQKEYPRDEHRFTLALYYLTGQRVTEGLYLKRDDISIKTLNGQEWMQVDSITEKNNENDRRVLLVPMFGREYEMTKYVYETIQGLEPRAKIFTVSRQTIDNWLKIVVWPVKALAPKKEGEKYSKYIDYKLPIHAHYLRHVRASHLSFDYDWGPRDLMNYFGWKSMKMIELYTRNNYRNLARAFMKGMELPENQVI